MADRELDVLGNAVGLVDRVGVLGDGLHDADVIHLLQGAAAQVVERPLATDHEDRRVGAPGVRDPGDAVGNARAGSDRRDPDLAPGLQRAQASAACTAACSWRTSTILYPLVEAPLVERHDVPHRKA